MESLNNSMEIQIVGTFENYILYYNFSETQMQRDGNGRQIYKSVLCFQRLQLDISLKCPKLKGKKEKKYINMCH